MQRVNQIIPFNLSAQTGLPKQPAKRHLSGNIESDTVKISFKSQNITVEDIKTSLNSLNLNSGEDISYVNNTPGNIGAIHAGNNDGINAQAHLFHEGRHPYVVLATLDNKNNLTVKITRESHEITPEHEKYQGVLNRFNSLINKAGYSGERSNLETRAFSAII